MTFKYLSIVALLYFSESAYGQLPLVKNLDKTEILKSVKVEGNIRNAVTWKDNSGENVVVTTETGIINGKDDNRNAAIYAYHFIQQNGKLIQTWKVSDFIKDCPVDLEATFLKDSFKITDLNKDGLAEIWLIYKTACHGDVSPFEMKIIMYQGEQKFAVRGHNKVKISEKQFAGGDYKFDKAFDEGPKIFRQFALDLWNKNIMQEWE